MQLLHFYRVDWSEILMTCLVKFGSHNSYKFYGDQLNVPFAIIQYNAILQCEIELQRLLLCRNAANRIPYQLSLKIDKKISFFYRVLVFQLMVAFPRIPHTYAFKLLYF